MNVAALRRRLWPNVAFHIYPDQVDFMQFVPMSPTETLIRAPQPPPPGWTHG